MILTDSSLYTLMLALAVLALSAGTLLYWINEPEKVKGAGRFAFKLILRLLSYPVTVVSIIVTFILMMMFTVIAYTLHRVNGEHVNYKVKVTFD
jgi:hypothetical protein